MTTTAWNKLQPFAIKALTAVKTEHCAPPAYRPAQDVSGRMVCPRCRGTIFFTVAADSGRSTGRCNSGVSCAHWTE